MNITCYVGSIVYRQAHGMPKLLPTLSYLLTSLATYVPCLSVVEIALFHQLGLKVHQLRIHGPQLRDVRQIPVRFPLLHHEPHLRDDPQQRAAEEAKHRAHGRSRHPLKRSAYVVEIRLVAGQPKRVVIPLLWMSERARGAKTPMPAVAMYYVFFASSVLHRPSGTPCAGAPGLGCS